MTSQQRRQSSPFKPNVPPQPVGPEYYDRALELVNYFRMQGNAPFVEMGRIPAAQQHADDCLAMGISSHWDLDGLKPYMRYSRAGGCQPTNAFFWNRTEPSGITDLELMLEDGVTWLFETMGNRRVVLDSIFRRVNLGIAWNQWLFVLVVEFEGDYVDFDRLPVIANNAIAFAGRVKKGVRLRSEDGLVAGVWSADYPRAIRVARGIRAGTVWIWGNYAQPVEGIWGSYKQSGMGRELGYHGLEDFLEVKQIFTDGTGLISKPPYGQVIKE